MEYKNKIIIVDDHPLFREGMKFLIETEGIGEVISEAENGQVFLNQLKDLSPDLVLMDIEMPEMDGIEATREALNLKPGLKVLVLSMFSDRERYIGMIKAGAMGFALKSAGKNELENAINTVIRGENYFPNSISQKVVVNHENRQAGSEYAT